MTDADLNGAVQRLLADMRDQHKRTTESIVGDEEKVRTHSTITADVSDLQREVSRLRDALEASQRALVAERDRHEQTRELLRLALKPPPGDESGGAVMGDETFASGNRGRSTCVTKEPPGFIKHATQHQMLLYSPSKSPVPSSGAVRELFDKVTSTTPRGHFRNPSPGGSARRGTPISASRNDERLNAFGSRTARFNEIALTGHHATIASRNAGYSYAEELTNSPKRTPSRSRTRSPACTDRSHRTKQSIGKYSSSVHTTTSPVFTGIVRGQANQLRAPDIAQWVKGIAQGPSSHAHDNEESH